MSGGVNSNEWGGKVPYLVMSGGVSEYIFMYLSVFIICIYLVYCLA
jgi:hypothetical protein